MDKVTFSGGNQQRVLSEVVSVDGWGAPAEGDERRVAFHVVLAFDTARMGGEDGMGSERMVTPSLFPAAPGVEISLVIGAQVAAGNRRP